MRRYPVDRKPFGTNRDVHTATVAAYGIIAVGDVTDRTAHGTGGRGPRTLLHS